MRKHGAAPSPRGAVPGSSRQASGSSAAAKAHATPRGTPRKKGALKSRAPASDLRQAFAAFDQDQDGALSHSELVAALSLPGPQAFSSPEEAARAADKIMADFDANGDGKLQFEEVTRTCAGPHVVAAHKFLSPGSRR